MPMCAINLGEVTVIGVVHMTPVTAQESDDGRNSTKEEDDKAGQMLDDELEDTSLSSSPLGRLHLSEGSDVFKAVMREFSVNSRIMLDNTNGSLTRNEASLAKNSDDDDASNPSSASERTHIREKYENICHHVRWVDEVLNLPLVKKCSADSRERSDHLSKTEEPKSILKCRATIFVMVSNR